MVKSRMAIPILLAMLAACGGGESQTSPVIPSSANLADTVDSIVRTELQQSGTPAISVGLGKNGTVIYANSYGLADVTNGIAATTSTIFELGSLTKQFTAAIILQLEQSGMLHVDDAVVAYLPEYGFSPDITLRMLLNHTSGLPDYLDFPDFQTWYFTGVTEGTVLSEIGAAPLRSTPGTVWQYSNSNYFLLGAIIEKVSNEPYAANLQQRIFTPLGLVSAYYDLPPTPPAALGYTRNAGGIRTVRLAARSSLFSAGAISADVLDVLRWDYGLYSGAVVSAASFAAMTTPAPVGVGDGSYYGFGLQLDTFAGRRRAFHTGFINGFLAYNELFLDNGFSLVVLMNGDFVDQQALGDQIYNAVCGAPRFASLC